MPEIETKHENYQPEENLIQVIWNEKREKLAERDDKLTTLCLPIKDPQIDIDETIGDILNILANNPEQSFHWSQNWGKTKIFLGTDNQTSSKFLQKGTTHYKSLFPISTTNLLQPSQLDSVSQPEYKYNILFNKKPITIEGAMLQIGRMVDELVWTTSINIRNDLQISHREAYEAALNDILNSGIGYSYCEEEEILNLRRSDPNYAVRMYGNVNGKSKVPNIIGAIVPIGHCPPLEPYQQPSILDFTSTEESVDTELDISQLETTPYIIFGMTIGKQPHMGHALLMGVADTVRETLGKETPIFMDANDTGPRIVATIATGAKLLNLSPVEITTLLSQGNISVRDFESWYRNRSCVNKKDMAYTMSKIKLDQVHLYKQAQRIETLIQDLFGSNSKVILESALLNDAHKIANLCSEKRWKDTGFGFYKKGKMLKILESDGIATAITMRTTVLINSSLSINKGIPIYIDTDPRIEDSLELYEKIIKIKGYQIPGAGLSINLEIASGTKGNSITLEDTYKILENTLSPREILNSIKHIVNTRQQVVGIDRKLPYFDYASDQDLIEDIKQGDIERSHFIDSIYEIYDKISTLTVETANKASFNEGNKTKKKVLLLKNLKEIVEGKKIESIFIKPRAIEEHKKIKSIIDRYQNTMTRQEATSLTYQEIMGTQKEDLSKIISHFKNHGYKGLQLENALQKFATLNAKLILRKGILYHTIDQIEEILKDSISIDNETSQILRESLKICENRISN